MEQEQWNPVDRFSFQDLLKFHLDYPDDTTIAYKVGDNALRCVGCGSTSPLEPCPNCGNPAYKLGGSSSVPGLFCNRCRRGSTSWKCKKCGTENPITYETLLVKAKKGFCFIATAVYGNDGAPEVLYLSAFRDDVLMRNAVGQLFVRFYYLISPGLANIVARFASLRLCVRVALLRPIILLLRL